MTEVRFLCRSVGFECEWALRAPSSEEVLRRMRDHVRCAHNLPDLSHDLEARVTSALHSA